MSERFRTTRVFFLGAAILTLIATILRTLSLALCLDPASGYFEAGAALPTCYRILSVLSALAFILFPLLALKDRVSQRRAEMTRVSLCASLLCAILFFLNFIMACTGRSALLPVPLWLFGLLFLLGGAVYFILQGLKSRVRDITTGTVTVFGCLCILGVACLISFTYFDIATPMNAPHKTELHLALLSLMLYLLYELRDVAGIPRPRALTASTALAFFFSVAVGASDLVAYCLGIYADPSYLIQDLLLVGFAFYIGARALNDCTVAASKQ